MAAACACTAKRSGSGHCRRHRSDSGHEPASAARRTERYGAPRTGSAETRRTVRNVGEPLHRGFRRRQGAKQCQAGVGNRSSGRPQCVAHRITGFGQDDAGPSNADHLAAADPRRSVGDDQNPLRGGQNGCCRRVDDPQTVPHAPPPDLAGCPRRRRTIALPGRSVAGAQRRTISGRTARIRPQRAGSAAPTLGR